MALPSNRSTAGWFLFAAVGPACAREATPDSAETGGSTTTSSAIASTSDSSGAGESLGVGSGSEGPLVDLAAWVPVAAEDDPWLSERPADAVCDAGWIYEDLVFEVDSELCTFGTFVQPTLLPVAPGDELELILLHDNLYSEDADAAAHVAIGLDGEVLWETSIPIPNLQSLVRPTFAVPFVAPAGTPVQFHVHNHGYNNYRMVGLSVL